MTPNQRGWFFSVMFCITLIALILLNEKYGSVTYNSQRVKCGQMRPVQVCQPQKGTTPYAAPVERSIKAWHEGKDVIWTRDRRGELVVITKENKTK
mgnify:CR=1 FL=1